MTSPTLRDYQEHAVETTRNYLQLYRGNPLVVMPTGSGKSHVIASILRRELAANRQRRFIMATHVKELVEQNAEKFAQHWPMPPMGIYCAGLKRREASFPVSMVSIQSVYRRAAEFGKIDAVLIDEAHLVPKGSWGMYHQFLNELADRNPKLNVIGFTATPYRTDGGSLTLGEERIFDNIVVDVPVGSLIDQGYLSPIVARPADASINLDGVGTRAGEFRKDQLESAAMVDDLVKRACAEIRELGHDRKRWLIFGCSVAHAEEIKLDMQANGVDIELVTGETPKDERANILKRYRSGSLHALVNVNVLTTGFDAPETDLVALMRATKSPGLYVQMVGRGMRTAPGKADCLVLDFGENADRHGPIDNIKEPGIKSSAPSDSDSSEAGKTKTCGECDFDGIWIGAPFCPNCSSPFESHKNHGMTASSTRILSGEQVESQAVALEPQRETVGGVGYSQHASAKGVSMRVDYYSPLGLKIASEWVCLSYEGFARRKAEEWWAERMDPEGMGGYDGSDAPTDVLEAVEMARAHQLPEPTAILVGPDPRNPKFQRIFSYEWGDAAEGEDPVEVDYEEVPF